MAVTSLYNRDEKLLHKIQRLYPELRHRQSDRFYWSAPDKTVHTAFTDHNEQEYWAYLHEIGHALLEHQTFRSDFELLELEMDAWEKAKTLAQTLDILIDEEHIQDCLDSYRDWLHQRSLCPTCELSGVESEEMYRCINCDSTWSVTKARICRPYRLKT